MAYTCPHCGHTGEPVNHNGRGWRCAGCFERLSLEAAAEFTVTPPAESAHVESQPGEPITPEVASGAPIGEDGDTVGQTPTESQPEPETPAKGKRKPAK